MIQRIKEGLSGKFQGLNNGLGRINQFIYYLQRKWYYLIGGLSGTGKTSLVDFILLNAFRDALRLQIPIDIFYYSYEIDEYTKFTQWFSNHLFIACGIEIPPEKIAGYGDNRLSEQELKLVEQELPVFEAIFNKVNFRFDPTNPTGIYRELLAYYEKHGSFIKEEYEGVNDFGTNEVKVRITGYEPADNRYVIVVMDHLALMKLERRYSLKENIDKMSEYCVWFRNICSTTFLILQQFNQGMHAIERKKHKGEDLLPQQNDFKDSGNPFQDCDTALGIMNPHDLDLQRLIGYDLGAIKRNFRAVNIIKNRKGKAHVAYGYFFNPKAGFFHVLPGADNMNQLVIDGINKGVYNGLHAGNILSH